MLPEGPPYELRPIGIVRSPLRRREDAPMQPDEDTPNAWIELDPAAAAGLEGISAGDELVLITWFHRAERDVLQVYARGDRSRPKTGVFATRSPDRPNPVGLHRVTVRQVDGSRLRVGPLEAIDGTPVLDIKRALEADR